MHTKEIFVFYKKFLLFLDKQNKFSDVQSPPPKKKIEALFFNTNYHEEMKLVLIIVDYGLLQFDALKFFLGVRLHGRGSLYLTLILFNVNLQILQ